MKKRNPVWYFVYGRLYPNTRSYRVMQTRSGLAAHLFARCWQWAARANPRNPEASAWVESFEVTQ